jgi:DNA-directed RNA polymerase specialized sigma24 family protein
MATKLATASADEDDIKLNLCGTTVQRQRALETLWTERREEVMSWVERRFPGLPSEIGAEVVASAFEDLVKRIDDPRFDWDQPLRPLLIKIAYRRAVDELRKWQVRPMSKADFYDFVGEEIKETVAAQAWAVQVRTNEANDTHQKFRDFVVTLPGLQRQIGQAIADNLPERIEHSEVCDEVYRRTGIRPTSAAVKSALRELRRKFRELINN